MFGALPYHIISHKDLTHADVRVLLAFAAFAGDDGRAFPSVRRIEAETPLSRRAIQSSLKKCVRLGLLKVTHRTDDRGCTSSIYSFQFERFDKSNTPRRNENAPGRSHDAPPAHSVRPPGAMVAPKHTKEQTKEHREHLAPATPGHTPKEGLKTRPKIGRNPAPTAKVVAVTRAYLDICVPARMPKVTTDADGMPSPAIAKTVAKAIKANGAEYDWRGLFTQASRGAHLRGENDRQWRASLAWLCNPTNAAKVESGNYGDTSPPPPPGTRRSYPNFPE